MPMKLPGAFMHGGSLAVPALSFLSNDGLATCRGDGDQSGEFVARLPRRLPHVQCPISRCNGPKLRGTARCCVKVYGRIASPRAIRACPAAPCFTANPGARREIPVNHLATADVDNPHRAQLVDNPGLLPALLSKQENH